MQSIAVMCTLSYYPDCLLTAHCWLQVALLHALGSTERILRNTVGSAIAAVVSATGLVAWPELVPVLTQCLSSLELTAVEGGLDALYQVKAMHWWFPGLNSVSLISSFRWVKAART